MKQPHILKTARVDTPLGQMMAVGDEEALYLLEFIDQKEFEQTIQRLRLKSGAEIVSGMTDSIASISGELQAYFDGRCMKFKTPLSPLGTIFQKCAWEELLRTPYGHTRSYTDQAKALGKPNAYRAVANANGANPIAIVIPCHRIVHKDGGLGGYASGLDRKQWLLDHEKRRRTV